MLGCYKQRGVHPGFRRPFEASKLYGGNNQYTARRQLYNFDHLASMISQTHESFTSTVTGNKTGLVGLVQYKLKKTLHSNGVPHSCECARGV